MTMVMEQERSGGTDGIDRSRVRLLSRVVEIGDRTGRALDIMNDDRLDFLPVVAEETSKLLGVVLRKGLERGCWGMGHDPNRCSVQNHLKTDVRFSFDDEPLDPGMVEVAGREPVVIVQPAPAGGDPPGRGGSVTPGAAMGDAARKLDGCLVGIYEPNPLGLA